MGQHSEKEDELRLYLLGGLTPRERARVEEQLFLDRKFFRQLESAEDDLVDEYVSGELSADDREKLENSLLSSPESRTDIRIAKALKKYIDAEAEPELLALDDDPDASVPDPPSPPVHHFVPRPRWRPASFYPALAAAAAIIVAVVTGLLPVLRDTPKSMRSPPPQARVSGTPEEDATRLGSSSNAGVELANGNSGSAVDPGATRPVQNQSPTPERGHDPAGTRRQVNRAPTRPPTPGSTYTATLLPVGVVRAEGGADNTIVIPAHANYVKLRLPVLTESDYYAYEATLTTDEGAPIKTWRGPMPVDAKGVRSINLPPVPVGLLSPQKYRLELRGGDRRGHLTALYTYHFQVAAP